MKKIVFLLTVVTVLAGALSVFSQEERERNAMNRLERLEVQVHRLAEQQSRLTSPMQPVAPRLAQTPVRPMASCPVPPECRVRCGRLVGLVAAVLAVIHILLAVWVFTDIRKRGEGSGIFIVLALLAGIPGTILYALVRLGDRVGEKKV